MLTAVTGSTWVTVVGIVLIASLVPVIWAIVDVARRPPWQFSTGRKVMWGLALGIGWMAVWPFALVASLVYLVVLRRRFPPADQPPNPMAGHHYTSATPGDRRGPGRFGAPGPYSQGPYGRGPFPQGHYGPGPGYPPGAGAPADPYGYHPSPASLPPAGWYPDPAGSSQERWWDGRGWSHHLRTRP